MKPTIWHGCYESSWSGFITSESFKHPAKFSRALIERIYDHMLAKGWLKPGDLVGDPFGGVATGGLIAAYRGLRWHGLELEPLFVELARANIELHRLRLQAISCPLPDIRQGDSRKFHEAIEDTVAMISSPPYAESLKGYKDGIDWDKAAPTKKTSGRHQAPGQSCHSIYGAEKGQIGAMPAGTLDGAVSSPPYGTREDGSGIAVNGDTSLSKGGKTIGRSCHAIVASPPYAAISAGAGGLNTKPAKKPGQQSGRTATLASQNTDQKYGQSEGQISRLKSGTVDGCVASPPYCETLHHGGGPNTARDKTRGGGSLQAIKDGYPESEGQIGALKSGTADAVVSSPPWEKNCEGGRKASRLGAATKILKCKRGHGASDAAVLAQAERDELKIYGDSAGQIGKESCETYWQAMMQVYSSCFLAIKAGGYIGIVVKDYVKDKKRVHLCDDTMRLLEHVGFVLVERVHAMLVKETTHADLFEGETVTTKSRKSFFRRLTESKGSPAIDFEEVLFMQKPL